MGLTWIPHPFSPLNFDCNKAKQTSTTTPSIFIYNIVYIMWFGTYQMILNLCFRSDSIRRWYYANTLSICWWKPPYFNPKSNNLRYCWNQFNDQINDLSASSTRKGHIKGLRCCLHNSFCLWIHKHYQTKFGNIMWYIFITILLTTSFTIYMHMNL